MARDGRWDVTSSDYLYMIEGKTAWYTVASPLFIGAISAGADEEAASGLIELGRPAGLAFQLQDDLLNLVGDADTQGKDFRSDITEGKRTLAVVWALEHLAPEPRAELVSLLEAKPPTPPIWPGPSSSSTWAVASRCAATSHVSSPTRRRSVRASLPDAAPSRPRRPTCSSPWRISSSTAARRAAQRKNAFRASPCRIYFARARTRRYIRPPAATSSADATKTTPTITQLPLPTAEAAAVEVTMDGMRPNVAIRTTGAKRILVSPAKYVRKSFGVPGMRKMTSITSSRRLALLSQENRSNRLRSKNNPTKRQPHRRVVQ